LSTTVLQQLKNKLLPPDERELAQLEIRPWYPVRLLGLYRLFVVVVLISLFFSGFAHIPLGKVDPPLFAYGVMLYLALTLLWLALIHWEYPSYTMQVYLQVTTDIVIIVALMHASGGIGSGLPILLVVNIGSATLILTASAGLLFSAFATLLIFAEQVYTQVATGTAVTTYPQAGALGAAFFGVTLVMLALKRRVRESELLAEQRELDIENLAQLNEHIVQHMQSGVIVVDTGGHARLINRAAKLQLGINEAHPPLPLEDLSAELVSRFDLWQTEPDHTPTRIRSPGSPFELQPHFAPLGAGGKAGTLIVLEDTTPYSREFQNIKLASLGRLTASIAHEIRNPLSAIRHASQLLSESENLGKPDLRLTEIIGQQTERVNAIIENILQLSIRDDSQHSDLELEGWLAGFVEEFRSQNGLTADEIDWTTDAEPVSVHADASQLHQVVWNLCGNCLKYGRDSKDNIRIRLTAGHDPDTGRAYLEVSDRGKGVPPEMQDKVFEPFYSGGQGSSGLGLYIVRELCEFNYARIRYVDRPGDGAVFRIQFSEPYTPEISLDSTQQP
jgi:two-component system sensor histidine kinase PilS (NtrC family)